MNHTPEPWTYDLTHCDVVDDISDLIMRPPNYPVASDEDRANARRIVACVNACEGIPTKTLEDPNFVDYLKKTYPAYFIELGYNANKDPLFEKNNK